MLTNPNTLGLFDKNILEITEIVHEAGGLNYYDGANLNAVMGMIRPGDMGFDVVHLNLHKTFSTPHGGGGPGSGPVGCKDLLAEFLPGSMVEEDKGYTFHHPASTIGQVKSFYGNFFNCGQSHDIFIYAWKGRRSGSLKACRIKRQLYDGAIKGCI